MVFNFNSLRYASTAPAKSPHGIKNLSRIGGSIGIYTLDLFGQLYGMRTQPSRGSPLTLRDIPRIWEARLTWDRSQPQVYRLCNEDTTKIVGRYGKHGIDLKGFAEHGLSPFMIAFFDRRTQPKLHDVRGKFECFLELSSGCGHSPHFIALINDNKPLRDRMKLSFSFMGSSSTALQNTVQAFGFMFLVRIFPTENDEPECR